MNESNSQAKKPKDNLRFSQEQHGILLRCSANKNTTEWNEWRAENPKEQILLEGADIHRIHLKDADLSKADLKDADLSHAHLEGVKFDEANLENAKLQYAHLEGARFWRAHMAHGHLWRARLQCAYLGEASIQHADLTDADLRGANIWRVNLVGAKFKTVVVDGSTLLWKCKVDPNTDFCGVGLDRVRMDPATKQLLEYNIRRMNWEKWYRWRDWHKGEPTEERSIAAKIWCWPVLLFWWISDYGLRTWRIIGTFFGLAFAFALVYWLLPSAVMVNGTIGDIRGFWHALYFSVVTMTTLGFGDIAANPNSWWG